MQAPIPLDVEVSARLHAAARGGALHEVLADPAVHSVVIALRCGQQPGASIVSVLRESDALARWVDLSCI
jgi:hypothetical protein